MPRHMFRRLIMMLTMPDLIMDSGGSTTTSQNQTIQNQLSFQRKSQCMLPIPFIQMLTKLEILSLFIGITLSNWM